MGRRREACSDCVTNCYSIHKKDGAEKSSCFFKVMIGDFGEKLRIPPAFLKHIENEDSNKVILEGPSEKHWTTTLERTTNGMFLRSGWDKFVKDHSIQLGEFLVFQYNGDSHFTVKIFDTTACEKEQAFCAENGEGSIFNEENQEDEQVKVEPCPWKGSGRRGKKPCVEVDGPVLYEGNKKQDEVKVEPSEMKNVRGNEDVFGVENGEGSIFGKENQKEEEVEMEPIQKKKRRGRPRKRPHVENFEVPIIFDEEKQEEEEVQAESTQKKNERGKPRERIHVKKIEEPILYKEEKEQEEVKVNTTWKKNGRGRPRKESVRLGITSKDKGVHITSEYKHQYFLSYRRPVTKEEKASAYEAANSFKSSRPCAQLVMAVSHVYMGFFVQLPTKLVRTHFPQQSQNINLRVPSGGIWCVKYIYYNGKGALSGGWRHFSLENNLECGDVLVLERVGPDFEYDAHIFRVAANPTGKLLIPRNGKALCSKISLLKALLAELRDKDHNS